MSATEAGVRGARRGGLSRYLKLIRFQHTLFALPFAYSGMLLAAGGWPGWSTFLWTTIAMVGARTAAMSLNRLVDARIDAANPRTASREIPRGVVTKGGASLLAVFGFALLGLAGWALNPLTLALLPVAVLALSLYSYTKRFTWACHLWLGTTIGAAAAGGWIAVTGEFSVGTVLLWLGVATWIAGFDVIYAILDLEFDRKHGVHSIPARFGEKGAVRISAGLYLISWLSLAALAPVLSLGWPYLVALLVVAAVLVYSQSLVHRFGAAQALRAFDANLYVSSLILLAVLADLFLT